MTIRTVVDSVSLVDAPPADLARIDAHLASLRRRYPGCHIERYLDRSPQIDESAHLGPGAVVIGDVRLFAQVSVWPGCVLRGDVSHVEIRERSNLQDGVVVHLGDHDPTLVAEDVVVGHRAVLHGCRVGGGSLIGIQATVLDGAVIGEGSVIGACALVTAGTEIPAHSLVLGAPGRVVKTLTAADEEFHRKLAGKYVRLAHNYRHG